MHKTLTTSKSNRHGHHSNYDLAADLENIKEALADASSDVKGRINEIILDSLDDVKMKSVDLKDQLEDYVVEKPFKAIGIALLSGLILGLFLRRR